MHITFNPHHTPEITNDWVSHVSNWWQSQDLNPSLPDWKPCFFLVTTPLCLGVKLWYDISSVFGGLGWTWKWQVFPQCDRLDRTAVTNGPSVTKKSLFLLTLHFSHASWQRACGGCFAQSRWGMPTSMPAAGVEGAQGESLTGSQSLYLGMTQAAWTHIPLAKVSHMATPDFKEAGKDIHVPGGEKDWSIWCTALLTTAMIYGDLYGRCPTWLFKKTEGTWPSSRSEAVVWLGLITPSLPFCLSQKS